MIERSKKRRIPLLLSFIAIMACLILFVMEFKGCQSMQTNTEMTFMPTGKSIKYDASGEIVFRLFSKGFIGCSRDGVTAYSFSGEELWNSTQTFNEPYMITDGDYTAVTEKDGRTIFVYDSKGFIYNVVIEKPVQNMALNKMGYLGVRYKKDESLYKTIVYRDAEHIIMESESADKGVYPLGLDISDNGQTVAMTYLDTSGIELLSRLVLYSTINLDNNILNFGTQKTNELFSTVQYCNDNSIIVVSDKNIYILTESGEEKFVIENSNEISNVSFSYDYFVLALGNKINPEKAKKPGTLVWYNLNGQEIATAELQRQPDNLNIYGKYLVVSDGVMYRCFDSSGNMIWQNPYTKDVKGVLPFDSSTKHMALIVSSDRAEIMEYAAKAKEAQ